MSSNYSILILRGFLFLPLPYMLFISLQNITLPEWTTLNMISPILGSILAILFLGEKINYFTTSAIFLGFIGVIFIIQPGFQYFSFYYLFPIYGAFTLALQSFLANKYSNITTTLSEFFSSNSFSNILQNPKTAPVGIPFFLERGGKA